MGPDKSAPKEVAAKSFILKGDAEPLSSAPVWAEPSQLLLGNWLSLDSHMTITPFIRMWLPNEGLSDAARSLTGDDLIW
jgi:hypothetical protein